MRNITKVFITGTNLLMILAPASILSSCSTKIEVQYIAHRGAPAGFNDAYSRRFENNKESFLSGGQQAKFMGLETDVYRTSDGKWVVVHDDSPFMDANGYRSAGDYVEEKTFNYCISQQIVPSKAYPSWVIGGGHYLTSFDEYLQICKDSGKNAIIEIKEPSHLADKYPCKGDTGYLLDASWNYLPDLWDQIVKNGMESNCYIISFQECYIRWFKTHHTELDGKHRLQQLCHWKHDGAPAQNDKYNTDFETLINNGYDVSAGDPETAYVGVNDYLPINKSMIDYAHSKNQKFGVWTVDIKSIADQYIKWGVDFITTDCYKFVNSKEDIPPSLFD